MHLLHALHALLHKSALQANMSVFRPLIDIADCERKQCDNDNSDYLYAVLEQLIGAGPKGINNTSTTIDEVLYGAQPNRT
jgi:hypothetical protein